MLALLVPGVGMGGGSSAGTSLIKPCGALTVHYVVSGVIAQRAVYAGIVSMRSNLTASITKVGCNV